MSIIDKLILKRLFSVFLIVFSTINGIMYMMNFTKISNRLFNLSFTDIIAMASFLSPMTMFETIQYVLLITIFIVVNDFFQSNELTIFKVTGLNNKKLVKPFIFIISFSIFIAIITQLIFPITIKKHSNNKNLYESAGILNTLKKNTFNDFGNHTIIFKNIENKNLLKDMIIIERKPEQETIIFSKTAEIGMDSNHEILLDLNDVEFIKIDKKDYNVNLSTNKNSQISFKTLTNIEAESPIKKVLKTISTEDLYMQCTKKNLNCKEFHRRILNIVQLLTIGLFLTFSLLQKNNLRIDRRFLDINTLLFLLFILGSTSFIAPILIKKNIVKILYLMHFGFILCLLKKYTK